MASFNKVILMGNLTRDPELRQTQSGTSVCRFSIAVNRSYSSQDGSMRDETCFVEIDCFGKSAENVAKYFSKGRPILVEGRLRQDSWEDKQTGQKRTKLMVVLERFEFVGSRNSDGNSGGGYSGGNSGGGYDNEYTPQPRGGSRQPRPRNDDMEDDDVPF
ncbi:MAG: single-stranded DNA-binding protein [Opitutales bacterium]|nr:single-stranded DNA-binding protein [Opitutales bacterium]